MSKKNNKATKARYHQLSLEREKEAQQKKLIKAEKKKQKENNQQRLGVSKTSKKTKKGGIRIRKGVTVKGIKIVDADSKRKVLAKLKAERKEHAMDVDEPSQKRKVLKAAKKTSKKQKAKDQTTAPMEE